MKRVVGMLCLLVFASVLEAAGTLKAGTFDPPRLAPDFALQGSDGRELRMSTYRGKVVLLSFGFTSCADVCPTTLGTLAQTRRNLGANAANVQVVYITVDPERDDTGKMKAYLRGFDPAFVGGSGTPAQLAAVRKDYGVSAEKKVFPDGGYIYAHSSFVYLIDRAGRIRALMPYGHSPDDYVHDLTILLKE